MVKDLAVVGGLITLAFVLAIVIMKISPGKKNNDKDT